MRTVPAYFTCIPLGVKGGLDESNLPAFLVAPQGSDSYVCLDAGTLLAGLKIACAKRCFEDIVHPVDSPLSLEGHIFHNHIKAYLISHPYLDHIQGLISISPEDNDKRIYGLPGVLDDVQQHMFNWRAWPNLCDKGEPPAIGKYTYTPLEPGKFISVEGTLMEVAAFPLAHGDFTSSSAFLVREKGHCILYMGDTGPDEVEKCTMTQDLWVEIAPYIKEKKLNAIFMEASYLDERPDDLLYSHLTPSWFMESMNRLALLVDEKNPHDALLGLNVVVIHMKPDLKAGVPVEDLIKKQLLERNILGLNLIFPQQGQFFEI